MMLNQAVSDKFTYISLMSFPLTLDHDGVVMNFDVCENPAYMDEDNQKACNVPDILANVVYIVPHQVFDFLTREVGEERIRRRSDVATLLHPEPDGYRYTKLIFPEL